MMFIYALMTLNQFPVFHSNSNPTGPISTRKVQSRWIMQSSEGLVSDGLTHLDSKSSLFPSLISPYSSSSEDACFHYYGFLPCADNIAGYIFQIVVLEYLLFVGDKILTRGSQKLFGIFGVSIYGAIVFRILMVLPGVFLVLASGLVGSQEDAKSTVVIGVGSVAGSTVFCLTLLWGICVLLGKTDINGVSSSEESEASNTTQFLLVKQKLRSFFTDSGIKTDKETSITAGIMLLSLIPYIMVQLTDITILRPWSRAVPVVTLAVSFLGLILYFVYQSRNEWIQERSLEYSRHELLLAGFLNYMQKCAEKKLVNEEGTLDICSIKRVFHTIDKDKDCSISKAELRSMLEDIKSEDLPLDQDFAFHKLVKHFYQNDNHLITEEEFVDGCERLFGEAIEIFSNADSHSGCLHELQVLQPLIEKRKNEIARIELQLWEILSDLEIQAFAFLLTEGKPDVTKIRSLFEEFDKDGNKTMTFHELKDMIRSKTANVDLNLDDVAAKMLRVFDKNGDNVLDVSEFIDGFGVWLTNGREPQLSDQCTEGQKHGVMAKLSWDSLNATLQVILGIAIVSSLVTPLLANTQYLSEDIGIPPFYISFVVLPLAMNFRTTVAAIAPASLKKERASSITFSEIYAEVIMNNILGLLSLLAIICGRGFTWDYSAEVLVIFVVGAIIGLLAFLRTTYPLWTSVLAFALYPLSLVLFFSLHYIWAWK